jgi:hypothetical protein
VCPGILWRFNARSDGNLDVVVLLRRRSEGGRKNFVTEDASVIKERVAWGGQVLPKRRSTECVKHYSQPREICAESQLRVEDTGAYSEGNSTGKTAVVPFKLQLVQNTPIIYTHPVLV